MNGSEFVNKGDPLILECQATGFNPRTDYLEWFKDGKIINHSYIWKHQRLRGRAINITDFHIIETRTLRRVLYIPKSTREDKGIYMCRIGGVYIVKKIVHVLDGEFEEGTRNEKHNVNDVHVPKTKTEKKTLNIFNIHFHNLPCYSFRFYYHIHV